MTSSLPAHRSGHQLSQRELRDLVERFSAAVRAGEHAPEFSTEERWHVRIHQDDDVDVWLISWTTEQGTELHDHGGSSGAFTVVSGAVNEYVWSGRRQDAPGVLVNHVRTEGETVSFGPHYVHDVRNHFEAPAVTVHAYSPPIRLMNYYDVPQYAGSSLLHWASNWTDDPEAPSPERRAS